MKEYRYIQLAYSYTHIQLAPSYTHIPHIPISNLPQHSGLETQMLFVGFEFLPRLSPDLEYGSSQQKKTKVSCK